MAVSGQRLGKHVPTGTDTKSTIEELFSMLSVPRCYKQGARLELSHTRVEAGSNTSIVTLLVVGGDEKGSLKSETVKYGHESKGTLTRERLCWRGRVAYIKERPVLSSERAPQENKTVTVKE
jgi:hypothetical protein